MLGFAASLLLAWVVGTSLERSAALVGLVGAVYAGIALGIRQGLLNDARAAAIAVGGLGGANRITLLRVTLALPLLGLVLWPQVIDDATRIWSVVLGTLALSLDGLDGWLARRTSTESSFGARFDMESDAALLMVLSVLAWRADQAGAWVLGIGLMRYAFVAAGWIWPWLNAPLPPSMRRKVICVVQGIALLIALAPLTPVVLGLGLLVAALATLTWSFAIDTWWLARHRTG